MTLVNLGTALRVLGDRESGTARLEEAVAAYREALQEYTREGVPLLWAQTQANLALAHLVFFHKDHQPRNLNGAALVQSARYLPTACSTRALNLLTDRRRLATGLYRGPHTASSFIRRWGQFAGSCREAPTRMASRRL
jgi:hypothetical protein